VLDSLALFLQLSTVYFAGIAARKAALGETFAMMNRIAQAAMMLGVGVALVTATRMAAAQVDEVHGFSFNDSNEKLTLTFASGPSDVISATAVGWWSPNAGNSPGNTNFIAGNIGPLLYNDFFTFDLSNLARLEAAQGPLTGATLSMTDFETLSDTGRTTEIQDFFDVSTDPTVLDTPLGTNAAIYNDLGSGKLYGTLNLPVTNTIDLSTVGTSLDAAALGDINADAGGLFSIGGTLAPQFAPAVPEPGPLAIGGAMLVAGAGMLLRRRRA